MVDSGAFCVFRFFFFSRCGIRRYIVYVMEEMLSCYVRIFCFVLVFFLGSLKVHGGCLAISLFSFTHWCSYRAILGIIPARWRC